MSHLSERCWSPHARSHAISDRKGLMKSPSAVRTAQKTDCCRQPMQSSHTAGLLAQSQGLSDARQVKTGFAPHDEGEFELDVTSGEFPETLKLGDVLGSGTFGIVHVGTCQETGEQFAVKVLKKKSGCLLNFDRIRNEVLAWRELTECDNAVKFVDCYEDKEHIYLVQELCTGGNLKDLFMARPEQRLEEIEVAQVASSILRIVAFCHKKAMCYGDVKPENFVLKFPYDAHENSLVAQEERLVVKAVDFGSARMNARAGNLRGENGSPLYRAPEAHDGAYGVEVDIWSVGVLMYHLLCGRPPFVHRVIQGEWEWSWRMAHKLQPDGLGFAITAIPLDFIGEKWELISDNAKDLLSKMLDRDVGRRITAVDALKHPWILENLAALETTCAGQGIRG